MNVMLYPEGGRTVRGLTGRVAFEVTDREGASMETSGTLTYPDGRSTEVATIREGRGWFSYTPSQQPARVESGTSDKRGAGKREEEVPECTRQ